LIWLEHEGKGRDGNRVGAIQLEEKNRRRNEGLEKRNGIKDV
jgi:hypothetical protein